VFNESEQLPDEESHPMKINSLNSNAYDGVSRFFTYNPEEQGASRTTYNGFRGYTRKSTNRRSQDDKSYSPNVNLIFGSLKKDKSFLTQNNVQKTLKNKQNTTNTS
jgi:hypothetical protein